VNANCVKADYALKNLRRWIKTGASYRWVESHNGAWNHDEWLELVSELQNSEFWPLHLDDVGISLDAVRQDYLKRKEELFAATSSRSLSRSLRWYLIGMLMVGLTAGFFAGMSKTPVVAVLLPLLFALIGGAGGLYLATAPLDSEIGLMRLRLIGKGLSGLSVACLLGVLFGISVRVLTTLSPLKQTVLGLKDPAEALEVLALRSRLRLLGASETDEAAILRRATDASSEVNLPVPTSRLNDILQKTNELATAMSSDVPAPLNAFTQHLGDLRETLMLFTSPGSSPSGTSLLKEDLYRKRISVLLKDFDPILDGSDAKIKTYVGQSTRLSRALADLFVALWSEYNNVGPEDWRLRSNLEKYLELFVRKSPDVQPSAVPWSPSPVFELEEHPPWDR
jgi:hypothetical protein